MRVALAVAVAVQLLVLGACTSTDGEAPNPPEQVDRQDLEERFEDAMTGFPEAQACGSDVVDGRPTVYVFAPPGSGVAEFRAELAAAMEVPESQLDVLDSSHECGPE